MNEFMSSDPIFEGNVLSKHFFDSLDDLRRKHDVKVILLERSPESVYDGLTERIDRIRENIGDHPNFGCWDDGVTMKYDNTLKSWVSLERSISIRNIKTNMDHVSVVYKKSFDRAFQWDKNDHICEFVRDFFGGK
jgi:hypothetical protein